eukprot:3888349-Ditylum_brightwellii.AAC.1
MNEKNDDKWNTSIGDDEVDDNDIDEIKKWVSSMSHDELLRAMEFSFLESDVGGASASTTTDFHMDGGGGGSASFPTAAISHEYDLLRQMIDLQRPPPVPIHPRSISYKPASSRYTASDGREECQGYERRKMKRDRFKHPRLFQFLERGIGLDSVGGLLDDIPGIHDVDLPPEVLAAIGNTTTKNRGKSRLSGNSNYHHNRRNRCYDVIAKKFITPWGEVLSIGPTHEQRLADERIVSGTRIIPPYSSGGPVRCSFCWSSAAVAATKKSMNGVETTTTRQRDWK